MKKIFTIAAIAASMMLAGTKASAQEWVATGGYTQMSFMGKDKVDNYNTSLPGFFFGVSLDYAFSTIDGLTVEPGVYFQHYGKEYSFVTTSKSYHANYISIPVNIKYTLPMEGAFELAAFTGPRFNLGVGGNMFSDGETYQGLKAAEAQWGVGLAATISDAVMFRAGYDFGLTRDIKDHSIGGLITVEDNSKVYRNAFYIGVGFIF